MPTKGTVDKIIYIDINQTFSDGAPPSMKLFGNIYRQLFRLKQ